VRYTEWVEAVLRAVLEGAGTPYMFGMPQIGTALDLEMGNWGDEEHRDLHLAIAAACDDLAEFALLDAENQWSVSPTFKARRYRRHALRELWPDLRAGDLEPDEELFLAKLAELSEVRHDAWAETRWVLSSEVFEALGWEWDRGRSIDVLRALEAGVFAKSRIPLGDQHDVRLKLAGAVRVSDEVGASLAEARDHLAVGRARAAGCVAGVELERSLKELCLARSVVVRDKLPSIADYNDALKGARVYPQATWRKIQHLSDLRNRCAHVLDLEPTDEDARELVDGIEAVLRALPS
jgi:hypothetical protein